MTKAAPKDLLKEVLGEKGYQVIFELSPEAIVIVDKQGRFVTANDRLKDWLGYEPEEFVGQALIKLNFLPRESRAIIVKNFARRMLGRIIEPYEVEFVSKGGEKKYGEIRGAVIRDQKGKALADLVMIRDVSGEREMKQSLNQTEVIFRQLFENSLNGIAYHQMIFAGERPVDFVYLKVNKMFTKLTGIVNPEGKKVSQVIPGFGEKSPELLGLYGKIARGGEAEKIESYVEQLQRWFSIAVFSPETGYFVTVFENITERKMGEEAMKEKLSELQSMNRVVVGRELKMIELKAKIKDLEERLTREKSE